MDEILIEEKKYLSSKRAAKLTGYAKDYIGQLCREGRVPARLVGRSWYVLESAIQDHRFNKDAAVEMPKEEKVINESAAKEIAEEKEWESPRYESAPTEILPPVVEKEKVSAPAPVLEEEQSPQDLQETWRAWFDHIASVKPAAEVAPAPVEEAPELEEALREEESEVAIPIRTVYDLPPQDLLPRREESAAERKEEVILHKEAEETRKPAKRRRKGVINIVRIAGGAIALVAAIFAIIGTGYFDKYIISSSQASLIAGVGLYNKQSN